MDVVWFLCEQPTVPRQRCISACTGLHSSCDRVNMRTEFVRGGELPPVRLTRAVKRGEREGERGRGREGGMV